MKTSTYVKEFCEDTIDYFVPVFVEMVKELGVNRSVIWSTIWQHAKIYGFCYASQSELERSLGMDKRVIRRGIKELESDGWIKRYYPDSKGLPSFVDPRTQCWIPNVGKYKTSFSNALKQNSDETFRLSDAEINEILMNNLKP